MAVFPMQVFVSLLVASLKEWSSIFLYLAILVMLLLSLLIDIWNHLHLRKLLCQCLHVPLYLFLIYLLLLFSSLPMDHFNIFLNDQPDFFFSFIYLFILLYNIVYILPYTDMNPPWVYMCSPSWILLPPPSPFPSGSSQCTSPKHSVSCIKPGLAICFTYDSLHVSMPFSHIILPSPSPTESKRLFYTPVSLLLSHIQGYHYHLSKFHIYVLVYCIGVFLSGLLHSVW